MSDQQQPELRWAPIPPKPKRAGRVWLIIGLVIAALIVAAVVLFFVLNQSGKPDAGSTASPTPTASASVSPTPSPAPTETATAEPTAEPTTPQTEPPTVDPDLATFRGQVSGWLGDAGTGLDIVAGSSGQDALSVIDTLQGDAQRLSGVQPPTSILEQWYSGTSAYSEKLQSLRSAVSAGSGEAAALQAARTEVADLKALVGL